jgi:hypothetical protein
MKYFFLSEGWQIGRVWELGGLWSQATHRRPPQIEQLAVTVMEGGDRLYLYRVESDVLMVEVMPSLAVEGKGEIGQVVLKRLITADQVIDRLAQAAQPPLGGIPKLPNLESVPPNF